MRQRRDFTTEEQLVALRLEMLAQTMDGVALALAGLSNAAAGEKADELRAAAAVARQWAKELDGAPS